MDRSLIEEILGPFRDPATQMESRESEGRVFIKFTRNGDDWNLVVDRTTEGVESRTHARRWKSLTSFVASERLANIPLLVRNQLNLFGEEQSRPIRQQIEVDGKRGRFNDVVRLVQQPSKRTTTVIVVDGPAGVGKTHMLRRLCRAQAEMFQTGKTEAADLYISSRGRRMSVLSDVIALSTQELRAPFTFDQVPSLVRLGLLNIIIDGFDELVDAEGYQDAWRAFRDFIDACAGIGTVIIAGRDTFFDQQNFYDRLNAQQAHKAKVDVKFVHLGSATLSEGCDWLLSQPRWDQKAVAEFRGLVSTRNQDYVLRPFFLSVLGETPLAALEHGDFRSVAVKSMLNREAPKLVAPDRQTSTAAIVSALTHAFKQIALDMYERESDAVDNDFVSLVLELEFAPRVNLSKDDVRAILHRAGSLAFLERHNVDSHLRRFTHQEFFHWFLSEALLDNLEQPTGWYILRKGTMGQDFLDVFAERAAYRPADVLRRTFENLKELYTKERSSDRLPLNIAVLLFAMVNCEQITQQAVLLEKLYVTTASFAEGGPSGRLVDCSIDLLNVRSADLSRVKFENCEVRSLEMDEETRFGQSFPLVTSLRIHDETGSKVERRPEAIQAVLASQAASAAVDDALDKPLVALFVSLCRRSLRQFYFSESDADNSMLPQLRDSLWPKLKSILEQHKRLEHRVVQMSGPHAELMHLKDPEGLLSPASREGAARAQIESLWTDLKAQA